MSGLRNIDRRKAKKALRKLGFEIDERRGKGSHALVYHPDERSRVTTLPCATPVRVGTMRGMLKELDITQAAFLEALD